MNKAIIIATVLITLSYQNLFSRNWERFAEIDSSFPETLVLDNYNSYQVEFEDHVFYANTIINWSINAAGASASAPALPFQRFVYGYLTKIELVACWDDESDTREVIYVYDNQEPYGYSAHGALNVPAGVETGLPSFFGGHKFRLILYCYYTGFYTSIGNDNQLPHNWVTEDDLTFDYYMFESPHVSFYADNLDPLNPSSIVDQLKHSNILAKWAGASSFEKPLVVVEGFDPSNNNYPAWYYNAGKILFDRARYDEGRDVYILNFEDGGNTMATSKNYDGDDYTYEITYNENQYDEFGNLVVVKVIDEVQYGNASVVQDATRFVSRLHSNDVVLTGLSMGGVVCRYALAAAQQKTEDCEYANDYRLPVSHFLSIDAPQQFATIDRGLQELVHEQVNNELDQLKHDTRDTVDDDSVGTSTLGSRAARELLWTNTDAQMRINSTRFDFESNPEHLSFYEQLNGLTEKNRGYPSYCRNLGVSFSSYDYYTGGLSGKKWLELTLNAQGSIKFKAFGGTFYTESFSFTRNQHVLNVSENSRCWFTGSMLPRNHTDMEIFNINSTINKSFLACIFRLKGKYISTLTSSADISPTFIPFVSALDIYDLKKLDSSSEPLLYPHSTYLFFGKKLDEFDHSFYFSYSGQVIGYDDEGIPEIYQNRYYDDNGTWEEIGQYNPDTGENEWFTVKARSRFDQILFNDILAPGFYHDEFPEKFNDTVFDFINDKVTEDITTWNNTWKNRAVLTRDININNKNTLYIKNGANNTISIDSNLGMTDQINLNIKDGATVVVEDNTFLKILKSVHINFEPGSTLILGNNCKIVLNNLSYFVINEGVNLELGESYEIKTEGYYARFIWK